MVLVVTEDFGATEMTWAMVMTDLVVICPSEEGVAREDVVVQ